MKGFFRILSFARPLGLYSVGYLILVLFATVFGVFNLTAFIPLLQLLFDQVEKNAVAIKPIWSFELVYFKEVFHYYFRNIIETQGKLIALYNLCGLIAASVLLANLLRYASQVILAKVRVRTIRNLRNAAFRAILDKQLGYFTTNKKGDMISRITGDVQEIEQSVVSSLKVLLKDPLLIIGYFIALFTISAQLTLYTLLLVPITGLLVSLIARRIKKWSARSQKSLGRLSSILEEAIGGMRIVKAFSAEKRLQERFAADVSHYADETYQIAKKTNLASPISEVMGTLVLIILLVIGGQMVLEENATIDAAQFIGFLIIFSQTLIPAKAISVAISQINRGLAAGDRVFDLMDQSNTTPETSLLGLEKNELIKGVSFQRVNFSYQQAPVLQDISFVLPKGKILALVGTSGSGKTTIADLLMGFYSPDSGEVLIDGVDLKTINQHSWRNLIGLVSQQPILFHDTVINNISFGGKANNLTQVKAAAQKANADTFITQLPNGYEAMLGESGDMLSGGEKQRITIARAIVNDPHLLILDEATSSLDALSEEAVGKAFRSAVSNRTTLIISHKRSTIELADEILLLDNGRIVEKGTPSELREKSHLYRQLTE